MNQIIQGDCLEVMRTMATNSVDAIVTDPPYGIAFMGRKWDYDVPSVAIWQECLRVLKPGGHLISFAGTRTHHRMAVNIEDAGFEIRDMLAWVYGSGFPKSHNLDGDWQGWGSALKPALEPITLARKPLQGTIAQNVQRWGTGGLNIDGCRVETGEPLGRQYGGGNQVYGKFGMERGTRTGDTLQGRWPANLIHDGSPEVVAVFPERTVAPPGKPSCGKKASIGGSGISFHKNYPEFIHYPDSGSAARFFQCCPDDDGEDAATRRLIYQGKATKRDRDEGLDGFEEKVASVGNVDGGSGRDAANPNNNWNDSCKRRVEQGLPPTMPRRNHHPTVKPTPLMRHLCRLITPPGGLILDPFAGSGSTGKAAVLEGFRFVGIEREPEYCEIARARILAAVQSSQALPLEERQAWLENHTGKIATPLHQQLALF